MKRILFVTSVLVLLVLGCAGADLVPNPEFGLRLQRGFDIHIVADNDLAPDTWCSTFDSRGRLVVANSQSIRTLVDTDGDGRADASTVFTHVSKGVMGMFF